MFVLGLLPGASASPWDVYGQGGARLGRGGGGMAIPGNLDSVVANPASLPGMARGEVGIGGLYGTFHLLPFPELWWDTNRDGRIDELDEPLDVQPTYEAVHGFTVALTHPFGDKIAAGLSAYVPTQHLMAIQSIEPSIPTYFLYANRMQRYDFAVELAARPALGIGIGAGLQILPRARFELAATLDATLSGTSDEEAAISDLVALGMDVHELSLDVVPGYAPNVSLHWDAGQAVAALDGLYLGASWRGASGLPIDVDLDLQINAGTGEVGDLGPILIPVVMGLQLGIFDHYQPEQVVLGAAWRIQRVATPSLDVRYTRWSRMLPSVANVVDATVNAAAVDLSDLEVTDGNSVAFELADTWSPRLGVDLAFPTVTGAERFGPVNVGIRGGIGLEPTPLVRQTAATAFLDADRLLWAVGASVAHDDPLHRREPRRMTWDLALQYHILANGSLDRGTPAAPVEGVGVDGAPIPIGGSFWAIGLHWRTEY